MFKICLKDQMKENQQNWRNIRSSWKRIKSKNGVFETKIWNQNNLGYILC